MYDAGFFDVIRKGCQDSAAVVAELVHGLLIGHVSEEDRYVIDVGCGEGWWAKAFEDLGWHATGIDGPGTSSVLDRFVPHDLTQPLPPPAASFGLAVSLEVAEHLPPERAESFIAELCSLAPVVLFSAAIPGQGGTGHVNEQWPGYWSELFNRNGYGVSGALRWEIWTDDRVENWYRQNLLFATSSPGWYPMLFDDVLHEPISVVHPVLYNARRG